MFKTDPSLQGGHRTRCLMLLPTALRCERSELLLSLPCCSSISFITSPRREKFWLLHCLLPWRSPRKGSKRALLALPELKGALSKIPLSSPMQGRPGVEQHHPVTVPQFFALGNASTYACWLWSPRDNMPTGHSPSVHSNSSVHPNHSDAPFSGAMPPSMQELEQVQS